MMVKLLPSLLVGLEKWSLADAFIVQGHYVLGHNFGLGSSQNLHDNLNQFGQVCAHL